MKGEVMNIDVVSIAQKRYEELKKFWDDNHPKPDECTVGDLTVGERFYCRDIEGMKKIIGSKRRDHKINPSLADVSRWVIVDRLDNYACKSGRYCVTPGGLGWWFRRFTPCRRVKKVKEKQFEMSNNKNWLNKMAKDEDYGCVSAGNSTLQEIEPKPDECTVKDLEVGVICEVEAGQRAFIACERIACDILDEDHDYVKIRIGGETIIVDRCIPCRRVKE